jgi:hypothetical protein
MSGEPEWRTFVADKLAALTPALTDVLRTLTSHAYPPEVARIDFEVFPDGFTEGFPVHALFKDAEGREVFVTVDGEAQSPSPVDPDLLEIDAVYSEEEEADFDADQLDLWVAAADELAIWFAACWSAAGGEGMAVRASIARHDDPESGVELVTGSLDANSVTP